MTQGFEVRYTAGARGNLHRLFDFLLDRAHAQAQEGSRHEPTFDAVFEDAQAVIDALVAEVESRLSRSPFIYRKVGPSPFLRELIVPCRSSGYVALYEIDGRSLVDILAVRHQREDDYY